MKELIVTINERYSDNFGEPIDYLVNRVLIPIGEENPDKITFDFTKCKFVNPFIISGIISISNTLKIENKQINFTYDKDNVKISSYFDTIHFPDGIKFSSLIQAELDKKFEEYYSKTFIPLVLFPTSITNEESKIREGILSAINAIFKEQLKLTGNTLAIYYLVDELTNNIADHSESEKGILFAQFYPTKNYMDICITDFGKGIKKTYLDSGKANPKSHEEALDFAIKGKSTKNQSISRGFGISTSRVMLTDGLKGKFLLWSGNAMFYQNLQKEEIISLPEVANFKGCLVALRIPTLPNSQFDFYKYIQ